MSFINKDDLIVKAMMMELVTGTITPFKQVNSHATKNFIEQIKRRNDYLAKDVQAKLKVFEFIIDEYENKVRDAIYKIWKESVYEDYNWHEALLNELNISIRK